MNETAPPNPEVLHVYGGVSLNCWTRTHHAPANWEDGTNIARELANGGPHKIIALYPAGVALRLESLPKLSRETAHVSREEIFPCTRLIAEKVEFVSAPAAPTPSPAKKSPERPTPAPVPAAAAASVSGGLFDNVDW